MEPHEPDDPETRQRYFESLRDLARNVERAFAEHESAGTPLEKTMREWGIFYRLTPEYLTAEAEDAEKRRQYYLSLRERGQRVERAFTKYDITGVPLEQAMRDEGIECPPGGLNLVSVTTYDAAGHMTSSRLGESKGL